MFSLSRVYPKETKKDFMYYMILEREGGKRMEDIAYKLDNPFSDVSLLR